MLDKSCISDMCKHMGQHCHLMATALLLYWHLHWCLLLLDSILSPLFLALTEENEEQRMYIWCVKKCWWTQDPESMMLDTWDVSGLERYSTAIVELLWYFLQKFSFCVAQYELVYRSVFTHLLIFNTSWKFLGWWYWKCRTRASRLKVSPVSQQRHTNDHQSELTLSSSAGSVEQK